MKKLLNQIRNFCNKHPLIMVLLVSAFLGWFIWWLGQPIKIIYYPDAPPLWMDDDPEGGYFPRH